MLYVRPSLSTLIELYVLYIVIVLTLSKGWRKYTYIGLNEFQRFMTPGTRNRRKLHVCLLYSVCVTACGYSKISGTVLKISLQIGMNYRSCMHSFNRLPYNFFHFWDLKTVQTILIKMVVRIEI